MAVLKLAILFLACIVGIHGQNLGLGSTCDEALLTPWPVLGNNKDYYACIGGIVLKLSCPGNTIFASAPNGKYFGCIPPWLSESQLNDYYPNVYYPNNNNNVYYPNNNVYYPNNNVYYPNNNVYYPNNNNNVYYPNNNNNIYYPNNNNNVYYPNNIDYPNNVYYPNNGNNPIVYYPNNNNNYYPNGYNPNVYYPNGNYPNSNPNIPIPMILGRSENDNGKS